MVEWNIAFLSKWVSLACQAPNHFHIGGGRNENGGREGEERRKRGEKERRGGGKGGEKGVGKKKKGEEGFGGRGALVPVAEPTVSGM